MKVKLSDIIDNLEMTNSEDEYWYDPKMNKFFSARDCEYQNLNEDEINEYNIMEEFIETIKDNNLLYNQLQIAINGSGAFRRFKDTCINFEIIEDWYKFKEEKYKKIATKWCKDSSVEYEEV